MEKNEILSLQEVKQLIADNKILSLAGDEKILSQLPEGNWIAGTTPYIIDKKNGGIFTKDKIYTEDLTGSVKNFKIKTYTEDNFDEISENIYDNGFTIFIIPAFSEIHEYFALNNRLIRKLYKNPFVGWISGFDLNDETGKAKVFNGKTSENFTDKAIAIHIELPENKQAGVNIVNIFKQNKEADEILFSENGFSAEECLINGEKQNFADYINNNNINTKIPIVADYSGIQINVSIKEVNTENKTVHFYAPVFKNRIYKFAVPVEDYKKEFKIKVPKLYNETAFSCNCILNYLYGELENKIISIGGPVTFGEIAYGLLNQTLVYMTVNDA